MLTANEVESFLVLGREQRNFEVKGKGTADGHLLMKVLRAAISMGNQAGGGYVCIGIANDQIAKMLPGLDPPDVAGWIDHDTLAAKLSNYADPPLNFDVQAQGLSNGVTVVIMEVHEFLDLPHLCKKAFDSVLREGALYVRPRKKVESSEVSTSVDMRDIIELATQKSVRRFVATAEGAGISISGSGQQTNAEKYENEAKDAWT